MVSGAQRDLSQSLSIPSISGVAGLALQLWLGHDHGNTPGEDKGKKCGHTNDTYGCDFVNG